MANQIDHDLCDIFRREFPIVGWTARRLAAPEACRYRTRHDITDADIIVTDLLHQRFTERIHGGLGRTVGGTGRKWILSGETADIDNPASPAVLQVRYRGVTAKEHSAQICFNDVMPRCDIRVGDAAEDADAGVIDQDVEAAELLNGTVDRMGCVIGISDIGDRGMHAIGARPLPARQLLPRIIELCRCTRSDRNPRPCVD